MRNILLACLLLAAPAAAQSIESVNGVAVPLGDVADIVRVSTGTQLAVHGSGFGGLTGTAKPKVFTSSDARPKKRPLKVVSFTDTDLVVEIKTGTVGDFDLTVQPKGKGLTPLVAAGIVRVVPPEFEAPNPQVASPSTLVTLTGAWGPETFGSKLGKVTVGGKKAKIVEWTKESIVFQMPAKLANGLYQVAVKNKIATSTVIDSVEGAPWCLQMDGSSFDVGGPDRFSCRLNNKKYKASGDFFTIFSSVQPGPPAPTTMVQIFAIISEGDPQKQMELDVPLALDTASFPMIIHGSADGTVVITESTGFLGLDQTHWSTANTGADPNDWIIVLHGYVMNAETGGHQLSGSFSASTVRTDGTAIPETYDVTVGDFRVTLD